MINIPPTGPNSQKSKFFGEVANAMEFLAIYHSLSMERQQHLLEVVAKLHAQQLGDKP